MHALIAQSHFHLMVLYAVMALCYAPEWIGSFFQRPEKGAIKRDRGSHVALIVAIAAGVVLGFWCVIGVRMATLTWQQPVQFWIGIALMLAGLAFRWHAIRVLGKFFTRDVATRPDQCVVETGPYRWIRHPSYTGSLLMLLGTGLAMTNWASLLAVVCGALIGHAYRVHVGDAYREYMRRTRRFIPFVW